MDSSSPSSSATTKTKSSTKKKFGLISSLHNSTIKSGKGSSSAKNTLTFLERDSKKQSKTETEILENYSKGIPITSADVLKLTTYTKSEYTFSIILVYLLLY